MLFHIFGQKGSLWTAGAFFWLRMLLTSMLQRGEKIEKIHKKATFLVAQYRKTKVCLRCLYITTSYNRSSVFRNCPSSRLPALGNFGSCWWESKHLKIKIGGKADHAHFPLRRSCGSGMLGSMVRKKKIRNAAACRAATARQEWTQTFICSFYVRDFCRHRCRIRTACMNSQPNWGLVKTLCLG